MLPSACLLAYIEVAAAYARQTHHLNVALTAIGLQWTISDFITANGEASGGKSEAAEEDVISVEELEEASLESMQEL